MTTQSSSTVVSRLAVAASVAALSISARAADITWENKTGDWTQDELWNGGVAPGSEDVASFKSGEMSITNAVQFGDEFHIGKSGTGVLTIEPTGAVTGGCYHVGRDGGTGTMIVNGGSVKATKSSGNWYGCFNIAWGSNSKGLVQLKSGTIEANHAAVGRSRAATGRLEISGGEFRALGDFNIGHDGIESGNVSRGEVVITGGRLLGSGGNINVASGSSSSGEMSIQGGVVENSKQLRIGGSEKAVGRLTMTGGAWTNTESSVYIGATGNALGYMTVNGGMFYSEKDLKVGNSSTATGRLTIGGTGVVEIGTGDNTLIGINGVDSVIRLNVGGRLIARWIHPDGAGTIEFNGGELIKNGNHPWAGQEIIAKEHTTKILAGGMVFNTQAGDAKITGTIVCNEGCGGIIKRGPSKLLIDPSGSNGKTCFYDGPVYVEEGTLEFANDVTLPDFVDVIRVAEGATLTLPSAVTCRVLENHGTINGTVAVESDAATKVASKAVWTGAMEDGDVYNAKNYIVYDQNGRVMYEQTITADIPVVVPYRAGAQIPSFDVFAEVTWAIEEDTCSEGYSRPAVVKTAAAWYDPSDANTLTKDDDNKVTAIQNKGTVGPALNLGLRSSNKGGAVVSDSAFNGTSSLYFNNASGYLSVGYFPEGLPANGPRTLFAVVCGKSTGYLSIAQHNDKEEGRSLLLASSFGKGYQIGYYSDTEEWKSAQVNFACSYDVPYVFWGRTSLGDEDTNIVTSCCIDSAGSMNGNTKNYNMPSSDSALSFKSYYGTFALGNSGYNEDTTGYQGEALIFTNALSDAEMDEVNAYLKGKWLDSNAMPDFDSMVVNAQVDLGGATRTFEKLSGSGSFVDGTVVVTGDLVVTVNADQSVVVPTFDKLVLGPSARLVVNGARNLPTSGTINIIPFTSLEGEFSSVVGDRNTRVILRYFEDHVCARRDSGMAVVIR